MPSLTPEQAAREQIDAMLLAAGWVVQDYKLLDFSAARGIALREVPLNTGPCDYLLLVDRKAVGVIEAKKAGTTLSTTAGPRGERIRDPRLEDAVRGTGHVVERATRSVDGKVCPHEADVLRGIPDRAQDRGQRGESQ